MTPIDVVKWLKQASQTTPESENPLVTVIITTYHRNDRLRNAIESVERQDYEPIETIVIDGSGEAHAKPVVAEYDVRYIAQDENRGVEADRALGAANAGGRYVAYLDDDDQFTPDKLTKQVALIEENDAVGVVYCGIVRESGHTVLPDPSVRGDVLEQALMFQTTPSRPSAMLIDAGVLGAVPFSNHHGAEDLGMKIELARRTEFDFIDEPLVSKSEHSGQVGGSMGNVEGRMIILQKYKDLYEKYPKSVRNTALAHTYLLEADFRLSNTKWSPLAVFRAAQACYYVPGLPVSFVGFLLASLFGRLGRDVARNVYERFLLSDTYRGGLT